MKTEYPGHAERAVRIPIQQGKYGSPLISSDMIDLCAPMLCDKIKAHYMDLGVKEVVFAHVMHGGGPFSSVAKPLCGKQPKPLPKDARHKEYCSSFEIIDAYIDIKSQTFKGRAEPKIIATDLTQEKCLGRQILFLDDLLETGATLEAAKLHVSKVCGYSSREVQQMTSFCTFTFKPGFPSQRFSPDFYGYRTSHHYLAGFGMDGCEQRHRHLPAIYVHDHRPELIDEKSWAFPFCLLPEDEPPVTD